jgi:putative ABC transport system substrate-binding protein
VRRRDVISVVAAIGGLPRWRLLSLGAAMFSRAAAGQQRDRVRLLGYLSGGGPGSDDALGYLQTRSLVEGLREHGWIEGRNIAIEYRYSGGELERVRTDAKELVALNPDVIVSTGGPSLRPCLKRPGPSRSSSP